MQVSPIQAPLLSFFSRPLYRSAATEWGGLAYGYLFLVILAFAVILSAQLYVQSSKFFQTSLPPFMDQIPDFTIEDGELSIDAPMPMEIKNPDTGDLIAVIDTRRGAKFPENINVSVERTRFVVKRNDVETRIYEFASFGDYKVTKESLQGFVKTIQALLVPLAFAALFLGGFIFCAVQVLIYALFGTLMASLTNTQLSYGALVRLSVVAITPVLILDIIWKLTQVTVPVWWLVSILIALGYLYFGISANAQTSTTHHSTSP